MFGGLFSEKGSGKVKANHPVVCLRKPYRTIHQERVWGSCIVRETLPLQTSDMGKKTVSVLAHLFLLP